MTEQTRTIAESKNFIILNEYTPKGEQSESYQSEDDLERELIADLVNQGYDFLPEVKTPKDLLENVRTQLQTLNNLSFSDGEWQRFAEGYLDKPSDGIVEKTRKIHDDYVVVKYF